MLVRPLKPEERESILARFPKESWEEVAQDIEEYESLLAGRLRQDPETHASPAAALDGVNRAERIAALRRKLCGPIEVNPPASSANRY
jgi:hypothetical protein